MTIRYKTMYDLSQPLYNSDNIMTEIQYTLYNEYTTLPLSLSIPVCLRKFVWWSVNSGGITRSRFWRRIIRKLVSIIDCSVSDARAVYSQATCRMQHSIHISCAARTNNNVAVSPATKVASCMVGLAEG